MGAARRTGGDRPAPSHRRLPAGHLLFLLFLLVIPCSARGGGEDFFARILLNRQPRGEMMVRREAGGRFLLREEDWNSLGLSIPGTVLSVEGGERLVPLSDLPGVATSFDEATVTLGITAAAERFPVYVKSLQGRRRGNVLRPDSDSAFLNLGVVASGGEGDSSASLPNELGIRRKGYLFLNAGSYDTGDGGSRYRRFSTSVLREDRERLTQVVLGDGTAESGDLGSIAEIGGVALRKKYRIDPYLQWAPQPSVRGTTLYPADVVVYVDNVPVASEHVPPGPFDLTDLSFYGGAGEVRVVVRDPFGREEELRRNYYFTDTVLKGGYDDFAFHAGLLRKKGAEGAGGYSDPAFSFFHRMGLTDELTFGIRGEGAGGRMNFGCTATRKAGTAGVVAVGVAAGRDGTGSPAPAAILSYAYQDRRFTFRASAETRGKGYGTAADEPGKGTKERLSAAFGYVSPGAGSLSADFLSLGRFEGNRETILLLAAARPLTRRLDLQGGYRHTNLGGGVNEVYLFLSWRTGTDCTVTARVTGGSGGDREEAEVRRNVPFGEGYGYSLRAARESRDGNGSYVLHPSGQYNGRRGTVTGEVESRFGTPSGTRYRLGASASVLSVAGETYLSRPVSDSFGVADAGGVAGVTVYQNGQPVGRTGTDGKVLLPSLNSYFENQLSLDDKELPIEYRVGEINRYVSPPFRSGSTVSFDVSRLQAVTGFLDIIRDGKAVPAEYGEARIEGAPEPVPTGRGGEFYLENLPPGVHGGTIVLEGRKWRFSVVVPESKEFILELGRIACEPAP
jgi:outer membrane usher protein FimD/PapC